MGVILGVFGGRGVAGWGLLVMVPLGPEKDVFMSWSPCFVRSVGPGGRVLVRLGHEVVDDYLEFVAARCRPNTVLAAGFDLKVFFSLVGKEPAEVTTADVLAFITAQRSVGDRKVVRLVDGESGLSARTIQRRLSSVSSSMSPVPLSPRSPSKPKGCQAPHNLTVVSPFPAFRLRSEVSLSRRVAK